MAQPFNPSLTKIRLYASILLLACFSQPLFQPLSTIMAPAVAQPVHRTFWLIGSSNWNWNFTSPNPGPQIEVFDRDTVTLLLKKSEFDGITHNWFLDFNNNGVVDTNEQGTSSPDFSSTTLYANFTFTAIIGNNIPGPGYWSYRCRYHPTSMYGQVAMRSTSPDFAVTASPASLRLARGSSNTSTISVTSLNNYTGSLTISTSVSPGGPSIALGRTGLSVAAGASNGTIVTVATTTSTPIGNFAIYVTASNGTSSRSTQVNVSIVDLASQTSTPVLPPMVLAAIIGTGIVMLAVITLAFARRRKRENTRPASGLSAK